MRGRKAHARMERRKKTGARLLNIDSATGAARSQPKLFMNFNHFRALLAGSSFAKRALLLESEPHSLEGVLLNLSSIS
jgi:hypothetical protein